MALPDSFRIQLGLPTLPADDIEPMLYDDFLQVFRAIQNLLRGVSTYCGVDAPPSDTWSSVVFAYTLLTGNLSRLYVPASVAISRGQAINLHNNAGVLNARLAVCTSAATMCHGVANNTVAIGGICEINYLQGLLDSIGGMTVGSLYYLSSVAGAIQTTRPSTVGQIIQSVGVALTTGQLAMAVSLQYQQL